MNFIKDAAHNFISDVEHKLQNIDKDHDGLADIAEAKKLVEEGSAELKTLEADFPSEKIAAALKVLFPDLTPAKVAVAESGLNKILSGVNHAAGLLPEIKNIV